MIQVSNEPVQSENSPVSEMNAAGAVDLNGPMKPANENGHQAIDSSVGLTPTPGNVVESTPKIDEKPPTPVTQTVTYLHFCSFLNIYPCFVHALNDSSFAANFHCAIAPTKVSHFLECINRTIWRAILSRSSSWVFTVSFYPLN